MTRQANQRMPNGDPNKEKAYDIQGVEYTKLQTEYQYFPEEYFTGSDLTIYFEHLWLDEITRMSFNLNERVEPIYGYNSYTWDAVARGSRIVTGYFAIAFKEAGYLYTALNLIGDLKEEAAPAIAYKMGDMGVPKWAADVKQKMEDMLFEQYQEHNMWAEDKVHSFTETETYEEEETEEKVTYTEVPAWGTLKHKMKNNEIKELQKVLIARKNKDIPLYPVWNEIVTWTQSETFKFGSGYKQHGLFHQNSKVKKIQDRLNILQPVIAPDKKPLKEDGYYGPITTAMVKAFQRFTESCAVDGIIGPKTAAHLGYGLSKPGDETGYFGTATKFIVTRFQQKAGLTADGIVESKTQTALGVGEKKAHKSYETKKVTKTRDVPKTRIIKRRKTEQEIREELAESNIPQEAEKAFTDYESGVWSRAFDDSNMQDYTTHFYRGKNQEFLLNEGFDIYINYGPLPEAVQQNQGAIPDNVNFNTTVKAIRNIQITGVEHVYGPDGTPIEEVYHFIAKDID